MRQVLRMLQSTTKKTFSLDELLSNAHLINDKIIDNKILRYIPDLCKVEDCEEFSTSKFEVLVENLEKDLVKDAILLHNNGMEFIRDVQKTISKLQPSIESSIQRLEILEFENTKANFNEDLDHFCAFYNTIDEVSNKVNGLAKFYSELYTMYEQERTIILKQEKAFQLAEEDFRNDLQMYEELINRMDKENLQLNQVKAEYDKLTE